MENFEEVADGTMLQKTVPDLPLTVDKMPFAEWRRFDKEYYQAWFTMAKRQTNRAITITVKMVRGKVYVKKTKKVNRS